MEYPHHRYLLYLLSKRLTPFEIRAECVAKSLIPPTDEALKELGAVLGPVPACWRASVEKTNVPFRRWLRDRKILPMWAQDASMEAALALLYRSTVRRDFEAILLAHGDVRQAHRELAVKYPEGIVPSVAALMRFYEFFWDLGSMSPEGLFNHVQLKEDSADYLPAVRGDLVTAYARLGLEQRISRERLLQKVVDMGFAMADRIHREKETIGGQSSAGLMVPVMGAIKAAEDLAQLRVGTEGDSSLKKDAADFMVRVVQSRAIPSIDELDVIDYIDAEEDEGESNVRRLPA